MDPYLSLVKYNLLRYSNPLLHLILFVEAYHEKSMGLCKKSKKNNETFLEKAIFLIGL